MSRGNIFFRAKKMNTSKNLSTLHTRFDKRFGPEYFKRIPREPGVFWMNDSKRQLLLLGHSKNLQYKLLLLRSYLLHSTPHTDSEIIQQIHEIHWTHCENSEASFYLEKKLAEQFNSAYKIENTEGESYYYLNFQPSKNQFKLSMSQKPSQQKYSFGAFRGKSPSLATYSALLRWLRYYFQGGSAMQWPSPFNKQFMPQKWTIHKSDSEINSPWLEKSIVNFFTGQNRDLLLCFTERIGKDIDTLDKFTRLWLHKDLCRLDRFYRAQITRNKNIIQCLGLNSHQVEPEWVAALRIRPNNIHF